MIKSKTKQTNKQNSLPLAHIWIPQKKRRCLQHEGIHANFILENKESYISSVLQTGENTNPIIIN